MGETELETLAPALSQHVCSRENVTTFVDKWSFSVVTHKEHYFFI